MEIILPKLGVTMNEGRIVKWLKKEGDYVRAGEILFEIETDKTTQEVEAPADGYLKTILVSAQDDSETIPVNTVVAIIE